MTASPFAFLRQWNLGAPIKALCANRRGDCFAVTLGNGTLALMSTDDTGDDPQILDAHEGPALALERDADNHAFLSGGDDGRILIAEPGIPAANPLFSCPGEKIEHVAATGEGLRAFASNQIVHLLSPEGLPMGEPLKLPGTITDVAFGPKGLFLAITHGSRLHLFDAHSINHPIQETTTSAPIRHLIWKPDRKRLYTLLEGGQIIEWGIQAGTAAPLIEKAKHTRPNSQGLSFLSLSANDRFLIAGGQDQAVCWPLGAEGDITEPSFLLGEASTRSVCKIAPNTKDDLVALGYNDGAIVLAPLDGRKEIVIFPPVATTGARVVGLVWNKDGDCLHAALENGHIFMFTTSSVSRFIRSHKK